MYLLDANVFITAHRTIYPFDVLPGYWDWLSLARSSGTIGSIERVRDELTSLEDRLQDWVDDQVGLDLTPDDATIEALRELAVWTMAEARFVPAAETEFLDVADYFLVGQAIAGGHIVVTNEVAAQGHGSGAQPDVRAGRSCAARIAVRIVASMEPGW